jgi:mRNA-degrading endonuclease RelE of RelBE toxin-antitoxin system
MAIYKIEWKRLALKELEKLPRPMISKVVSAVDHLSSNSFSNGVRNKWAQKIPIESELETIGYFTVSLKKD